MFQVHPSARTESIGVTWPIVMWLSQAIVPLGLCGLWLLRLAQGPPPGKLMWAAAGGSAGWLVLVAAIAARKAGRLWVVRNRYQLILSATTAVLALAVVGEAGVRVAGSRDEDDNFFFRGHQLQPFRLPVKRVEAAVAAYRSAKTSVIVDDPATGWMPRPGSRNDLYAYNDATIRVSDPGTTYTKMPSPGTLRISIFGDSFTNGVDEQYRPDLGGPARAKSGGHRASV